MSDGATFAGGDPRHGGGSGVGGHATPVTSRGGEARIEASYGQLPLRFERNEGQVDSRVRCLARGPGYTMFVTPTEAVPSLRKGAEGRGQPRPRAGENERRAAGASVLWVKLLGARSDAELQGLEELPGRTHYLIGNDPRQWRRSVASYARLRCRRVYKGVDLV